MSLAKRWGVLVPSILVLLSLLLLVPIVPVQAQTSGIGVRFERTSESPVDVSFRVWITNSAPQPEKLLTVTALLRDLSLPITALNQVSVEQVAIQDYVVGIPIYEVAVLTQTEKEQWVDDYLQILRDMGEPVPELITYTKKVDYLATFGVTVPETQRVVVGYNYETRYREVKEDYKDWYFKGSTPKMEATVNLPASDDDEYGFGGGTLVLDFTVNTGTQVRNDGKWGSKGLLVLNIDGKQYYDNTNSSWWDNSWNYRMKLTFANGTINENITNALVTATLDSSNFDFSKARNDGYDIRLVDADAATNLKYFRASYNATAETADFIFQVPQIDANSNTDYVWLYYGNNSAGDGEDKTFTNDIVLNDPLWSSRLSGSPFDSVDSYSHTNTVTGATWGTQGRSFDGNDKITISTITITDNTSWTYMFWISPTSVDADMGLYGNAFVPGQYTRCFFKTLDQRVYNDANIFAQWTSAITAITQLWTFVCNGSDANNMEFFINATSQGKKTLDDSSQTIKLLGEIGAGVVPFNGTIGEVLIYSRALSQPETQQRYLATQYKWGGASYITYGSAEYFALGKPTNFTITDLGGNTVNLSWTLGTYSDNTTIRYKRNSYPVTVTDGEPAYSGNLTTANVTGLSLETTTYYFRAWSQRSTGEYSETYADANIGGTGMLVLTIILVIFGLTALAFILTSGVLHMVCIPAWLIAAFVLGNQPWSGDNTYLKTAVIFLAIIMVIVHIAMVVTRYLGLRVEPPTHDSIQADYRRKVLDVTRRKEPREW